MTTEASRTSKSTSRRKFLAGAALAGAAAVAMPQVSRAQTVTWKFQSTWPTKDIFHEDAVDYAKKEQKENGSWGKAQPEGVTGVMVAGLLRNGLKADDAPVAKGLQFIESLVNRHRIEVYVLDANGRIAASFERIHWDEQQVVDRAVALLNEAQQPQAGPSAASSLVATAASLGVAFFPKCPVCWGAYMSVAGITGLEQIPYSPWLQPVFVVLMLLNLVSVWLRGRTTGRMIGVYLVAAGAMLIVLSKIGFGLEQAGGFGVALTLLGSLMSSLNQPLLDAGRRG